MLVLGTGLYLTRPKRSGQRSQKGVTVVRSTRTGNGAVTPNQDYAEKDLLASNSLNPQKHGYC